MRNERVKLRETGARGAGSILSAEAAKAAIAGFWQFCRRKPLGAVSVFIIVVMLVLAIGTEVIAPNDPLRLYAGHNFAPPGTTPPGGSIMVLGGDELGRDLFSRIVFGARISLIVGIGTVFVGLLIGVVIGLVSGYFGGWIDLIVQRFVDGIMAIPFLILVLLMITLMGRGASIGGASVNVIIVLGIALFPITSRVVRASTLSVKENVYVDAARALGASDVRIITRHILPNVSHAIIILGATYLGVAILAEATLSFLGLGTVEPNPSWGLMIAGPGRGNLVKHPMLVLAPGVAISLAVLAFNLLGDALRDVWDPRLRI